MGQEDGLWILAYLSLRGCGSDLCVDRTCVWIGGVKRSTGEGKLTVGLRLAQ